MSEAAHTVDLEALGVYDEVSAQRDAFARVLLVGPAKAGKTTCLASTAPAPLVINCDGVGATIGAINHGAKFLAVDAVSKRSWNAAVTTAGKLVAADKARTVILDTISLLEDNLLDEITLTAEGFEVWRELDLQLSRGIKALLKLEAHVFLVAHMTPDYEGAAGILPAIRGRSKIRIPGLIADWVMLDVDPERKPHPRQFLLGPQRFWTHSGRNIKRVCAIEASVPVLLGELGITP